MKKKTRYENKEHLLFVSTFPCMVCGAYPVQVHHLLKPRDGKRGWGLKAGDNTNLEPEKRSGGGEDVRSEKLWREENSNKRYLAAAPQAEIPLAPLLRILREVVIPPPLLSLRSALQLLLPARARDARER